jgi:tight adherence protein B
MHGIPRVLSHLLNTAGSNIGPLQAAALVACTAVLLFAAVAVTLTRPNRDLAEQLNPYQIRPPSEEPAPKEGVVTMAALRRLGEALSGAAKKNGFADRIEAQIRRAGLSITAGELMVVSLLGGLFLAVLGAVAVGFVGFVGALVIAGLAPSATLRFLAGRRTRQFDTQLPDVLKLLSASLRAGFSLLQSLDSLIAQIGDPMGIELRRAFSSTRLGMGVEEALQGVADRVGSQDFGWVVMAIQIQREVGGNLAEILDSVAGTMTARVHLRREVRTLTAEGRMSAYVLVGLPPALGAMVFMSNRPYIMTLFNTHGGHLALIVGAVMEAAGGFWLKKTVTIEI